MAAMFASAIIYIFKETQKIRKGNAKCFRSSPVNSFWSKFKCSEKKIPICKDTMVKAC